jgi:alginate O-acetyltransferase complex protein AlgI
MIFSSLQYVLFLPIVVFLYWRTRGGARLTLVVLASYFFYMCWLPIYGLLLLALSAANWALGVALARCQPKQETQNEVREQPAAKPGSLAKALLAVGLVLNLGCLCYYKYTNFIVSNVLDTLNWLNVNLLHAPAMAQPHSPLVNVFLPLGISFFVFEFVHYLVDVYKGSKPINSFMEFAAFASFFPSQIAGPIKRYQDFNDRLRAPEAWSSNLFYEGMALIMQGMFKKVAIADPIGAVVFRPFMAMQPMSSPDAIIAAIGFVIQVYCDFSGYTDIGRGSALLLGIRLPENFNLPYLAHDLADFWRRWHMSLSYWLRDYVYIPCGGSRGGKLINARNLFITMVACGLWHGASWHYVVFGAMQGLGLIVHREYRDFMLQFKSIQPAFNSLPARAFGTFLTMAFITVSYAVFRAPDMPHAFNILGSAFSFTGTCLLWDSVIKLNVLPFLTIYASFWLLTEHLIRNPQFLLPIRETEPNSILRYSAPLRLASWTAAIVIMIAARPNEAIPFVYFQF